MDVEEQEGLPNHFIEELCCFLKAIPGCEDIPSMMLTALSKLDVDSQSIERNHDKQSCNDGLNKAEQNKTSMSIIEIRTLQHFIFSNITDMDTIPKGIQNDLVYRGMLSNVTEIQSMSFKDYLLKESSQDDWVEDTDDNNNNNHNLNTNTHPTHPFLFTEFFSRLTKLKAVRIEASAVPWESDFSCIESSWDPFVNITGPVIFPSLELFELSDDQMFLDIVATINNLVKYCSFPNLQDLRLPESFFGLRNRVQIRALLDYLTSLPNLKSFLPTQLFERVSQEMIEELVGYAPALLSTIKRLMVTEVDPHLRDLLLKSPHLTGLEDLSFDKSFKDRHDFDSTSDWLFKMNWIGNITNFTLTDQECQLSQHSVENILTSPFLNNLESLSFGHSPMDQVAQDALSCLLSSDKIIKLTVLQLHNPNDDHLAIITTSPYLTQLQYLNCQEIPDTFFSSISSSKTLTNLTGIWFGPISLSSFYKNEAAVTTDLIPLFHSPNTQHFTSTSFANLSSITPNGLKSFLSSPYVTKQHALMIMHRKDVNPTEWTQVFFSNPAWSNLLYLNLNNNGLGDDEIKDFSEAAHFRNVKTLDLSGNSKITQQGLLYLAQSPHLINVEDLNLGFVSNFFQIDSNSPPVYSSETLIRFFQSPYLCKLRKLIIACNPLENFEALEYLVDNPHIFYNSDGGLVRELPELQCLCPSYNLDRGSDHINKDKLFNLARRAPFIIKIKTGPYLDEIILG